MNKLSLATAVVTAANQNIELPYRKMNKAKKVILLNASLLILLFLSIVLLDKPLASFIAGYAAPVQPFFYKVTAFLDSFSVYVAPLLLTCFVLGLLLALSRKTRKAGFVLLTLAFVNIIASALTNTMKTELRRARPELYLKEGSGGADFYNQQTRDYSFPSSHTSFYLSLFLPVALAFRKLAPLLLLIPAVVIVGRVVQNEHYLSDVLCSILIVFNLCFLMLQLLCGVERIRSRTPETIQRSVGA